MRTEGQYRFKITNEELFDKYSDKFWDLAPNLLNAIGWKMDYNNSFPILEIEDLTAASSKNQQTILDSLSKCSKDISEVMLNENKKMKENKKLLKETSHEFHGPTNVMNYDEGSFTKIVKELFKDYDGFSLNSIQAEGDGEWYNINVTVDVSEEYEELESKRFVLSQKIHKLKSEFFAELSQYLPVVNSTIGAVELTKLEDKAKFCITVLLSKTNVRNWVTGRKPEKTDLKDLNKNILDILNGE